MRRTSEGFVLLAGLALGCGSSGDDEDSGRLNGPDLTIGETVAIDGAGSPPSWRVLDESFVVRDFAASSAGALALVGSLYERDFSFAGTTHASLGGSDGLIATLSSEGQAGWGQSFGGIKADEALAVALRPSGNLIVSGFFRDAIELGASSLSDERVKPGFSDPYFDFDTGALLVFELDPNGELVWSQFFTSMTGEGAVSDVALADGGDVVIAGRALGDLDFGDGVTSGDGIFVARLGPSGEHVASARFEGSGARLTTLAVDADGVVLGGAYQGTFDLGGALPETGPDEDGFVARLDESLVPLWSLRFGGMNDDSVVDVTLTDDGAALVGGYFSATLDLAEPVAREDETGFVARIAADGTTEWARAFAGAGRSRVMSLVLDGDNVIAGGGYRDGVDLGGGELLSDSDDGFVTGLAAADGAHLFSRRIPRFNFAGLARHESQLFVAGTCEGVSAIGGEIIPPAATSQLVVAALSTDVESHLGRWTAAAELNFEGTAHPIVSAIALPGTAPQNSSGVTLVLSAADIDCSSGSQVPSLNAPRRPEPELALLLQAGELGWHSVTSWLSADGGGSGGSSLVLVESITESEITAYVEHHEEATGSSATASYAMGKVTFRRCF